MPIVVRWSPLHSSKLSALGYNPSIEHWRVQVCIGSATSALRTFELRRDPLSKQWLLESITDS